MTAIQIRDVYHEFTSIPGVKEDVTQIVLNVKKLRLKSFATHPVQLKLIKSGAGIVTAADIQESADVEVVNPDLPIMTLDSDDVTIEMDLTVEKGVGYLAAERAESNPDRRHPGRRDLHARPQGQLLGREHSRRADDQLRQADDRAGDRRHDLAGGGARPRRGHPRPPVLALRQHRPRRRRPGSRRPASVPQLPPNMLDMPIEELDLPMRAYNSLKRNNIVKVGQLLQLSDDDLLRMRNFGKKSLDEMKERLRMRGFILPDSDESSLGDDLEDVEDEETFDDLPPEEA